MESINNKIRRAVNGEEDALKFIHQHYLYIGDKFYDKNKDKVSKEELYLIIKQAIDEFCVIEVNIPLILHIYKRINEELNKKRELRVDVRGTILSACQGDMNARNKLIKHYTPIVLEKAKDYDYLEYEELVQFGILKLIEYIDTLIEEHQNSEFPTTGIARSIDIYFSKTLKNSVTLWNTPLNYYEEELDNFQIQYEFEDMVDSYIKSDIKRDIIKKYFLDRYTLKEIGKQHNISRENVRLMVKKAKLLLKKNYFK